MFQSKQPLPVGQWPGSVAETPSPLFPPASFLGLCRLSQAILRSGRAANAGAQMETVGLSPELVRRLP